MIEFAFCLPFLAFILALIFFFGWSMNNKQHVKMAARHVVWRSVRGPSDVTGAEANAKFFRDKSDYVNINNPRGWPQDTPQNYMAITQFPEQSSRDLAQNMIIDTFPFGRQATMEAHFPTSVSLWQKFQGNISSKMARDGLEWRRRQVNWNRPVKDTFLTDVDTMLETIPSPGTGFGTLMQRLYMQQW